MRKKRPAKKGLSLAERKDERKDEKKNAHASLRNFGNKEYPRMSLRVPSIKTKNAPQSLAALILAPVCATPVYQFANLKRMNPNYMACGGVDSALPMF